MASMHRRTRLTLLIVAAFLAALVLAVIIATYVLLQPDNITSMLRKQAHRAGLTLSLATPAKPTLWPQPGLVLRGVTLSADNRPVLVASRARVVLPWRALFGGPVAITQLELDSPQLDVTRLQRVLARLPTKPTGTPHLPRIDTGMKIRHGSLVHDGKLLLRDMHLETGPLAPGHVFSLQLTASTRGQPFKLDLLTTPHPDSGAVRFTHTHLTLDLASAGSSGVLDGQATWRGGSRIKAHFQGTFTSKNHGRYATRLQLTPGHGDHRFVLNVTTKGPDVDAHVHVPLADAIAWWQQITRPGKNEPLSLPPVEGTVHAGELNLGGMHLQGIRIRSGTATASSTAAATSAPAAPATAVKP